MPLGLCMTQKNYLIMLTRQNGAVMLAPEFVLLLFLPMCGLLPVIWISCYCYYR